MKIGDALHFPFRGKHAWPNIGCLLLCFLIPIIGPIVAQGYQCAVEKALVLNIHEDAPSFDFGKFGLYLQRGVMPFMATLLAMLVMLPLFFVLGGILALCIVLLIKETTLLIALVIMAVIFWLIFILFMGVAMVPVVFRAGVQQTIMGAFKKEFILDYLRRVGWQTLLANFQIMLVMLPAMLVMCIPFAGYALFGVLMQVQAHVRAQLYLHYLDRGGQPLDIHPDPPEGAFPVVIP